MARESVDFEVTYTAAELSAIVSDWGKKKFGRVKRGIGGRIHFLEKSQGIVASDGSALWNLRSNLQMLAVEQGEREREQTKRFAVEKPVDGASLV